MIKAINSCILFALLAVCAHGSDISTVSESKPLLVSVSSSTPTYDYPASFRLSITFENRSEKPLVILPALLHRHYLQLETGRAKYVPYPGPLILPWKGAFVLSAQTNRVIETKGMRDGDGVWVLEPGSYQISVKYAVDSELEAEREAAELPLQLAKIPIWYGELESKPIKIFFATESEEINNREIVDTLLADVSKSASLEIEYRKISGLSDRYQWHIGDSFYGIRFQPRERYDINKLDKKKKYEVKCIVLEQNYGVIDVWVKEIKEIDKTEKHIVNEVDESKAFKIASGILEQEIELDGIRYPVFGLKDQKWWLITESIEDTAWHCSWNGNPKGGGYNGFVIIRKSDGKVLKKNLSHHGR